MKVPFKTKKVIDVDDWDRLVIETYKRPYCFQQQDGCKDRGIFDFTVPDAAEDFERDAVPEIINHNDMGVSFSAWLARDPKNTSGRRRGKKRLGYKHVVGKKFLSRISNGGE
mgnify:CR=1 FL=1